MKSETFRWFIASALLASTPLIGSAGTPASTPPAYLHRFARLASRQLVSLDERWNAATRKLAVLPRTPLDQQSERLGFHSAFSISSTQTLWLQLDLGAAELLDALVLIPCDVAYGDNPGPGYGFPARFRVELSNDAEFRNPTVLMNETETDFPNPGNLPVFIPADGRSARYIRVTATRLWSRGDQYLFALGEVMALRGNLNVAAGARATANRPYNNPPAWRPENATDGQSVLGPPIINKETPGNGYHSIEAAKVPDTTGWVQVDLEKPMPLDEVRLFPARPGDFPARRGFGFPVRFRIEACDEPGFDNPILITDQTKEDFTNPAENPVAFRAKGCIGRFVRVTATRWWQRNNDFVFALAEMSVYSLNTNRARAKPVAANFSTEAPTWKKQYLVDGFTSQGEIMEWPVWLQELSARRETLLELASLNRERERVTAEVITKGIWWIGIASLILILLGIALNYRLRLRRLHEVELLRTRIAADLHDEIGSNLGSIALLSAMPSKTFLESDEKQLLAEINRTASQTLDSMREIVWLIHPGHDQLGDLAERLRDFAKQMLAGISFKFEIPRQQVGIRLPLDFRRNVFLVFKEALHNIVKHAHASQVEIWLAEDSDRFNLTIRDNGIGFDQSHGTAGHGLQNMRQRVEKLGGELKIRSAPGSGTDVCLSLQIA